MRMSSWRRAVVACTAAATATLASGAPLRGQVTLPDGAERRQPIPALAVSGSGEARVAPDQATVRLGVSARAPDAGAAQQQVSRTAAAILAAIRKLGVAAAQIKTSELSLNPLYAPSRPGSGNGNDEPRITGYQATNVVSVELDLPDRGLDRVGPVIDAGLAAGANRVEGVVFALRDEEPARAAALAQAAANARRKAAVLAAALRVRLDEVLEVSEQGTQVVSPRYRMTMAMAAGAVAPTPVSSGQITVTAAVTVRYRIAPCPAQGPCN